MRCIKFFILFPCFQWDEYDLKMREALLRFGPLPTESDITNKDNEIDDNDNISNKKVEYFYIFFHSCREWIFAFNYIFIFLLYFFFNETTHEDPKQNPELIEPSDKPSENQNKVKLFCL